MPAFLDSEIIDITKKKWKSTNKNLDKPRKLILALQALLSKEAQALLPSYDALLQRLHRKKEDPY